MDIFGTTIVAIHEIYNITVFIRGVVKSTQNFDADRVSIEHRLHHELLFLDSFKSLFFDDDGAFISNEHLPIYLKHDVHNTIMYLRKSLAEYGMLAAKYEVLDIQTDGHEQTGSANNTKDMSVSVYQRVKGRVEDLKKRAVDWALFDKTKMLKTLEEYSAQTERLRQTMSLMLLTMAAMGSTELRDFAESKRARNMGLQNVVKRQLLTLGHPPDDFTALGGWLEEIAESSTGSNLKLARYEGDWGPVQTVVVEYRKYDDTLMTAPDISFDKSMAPIRDLAWLLVSATGLDKKEVITVGGASYGPSISTLPCLGYLDEPGEGRTAFLYQLPRSQDIQPVGNIVTLHGRINDQSFRGRPPLGSRFLLAHTLASTLLGIHTCGWVHKNISSRGIIVYPSVGRQRLIPYVAGWGYARNIDGGTLLVNADTDLEANLYRHPLRQGQPRDSFKPEHDIYTLGVILLEIALWRTVSDVFKKQIEAASTTGKVPEPERITRALVDIAHQDIPGEMGEGYARAVERCLTGDFGVQADGDPKQTQLSVAFRELVVDVVATGIEL
ncbi:hypothetical protein BDW59DRAFT_140183 [Aspergillus cavernicola]|uniref:Protein kinase domain-containing protein n=1 Tax=Aspergillus cavernicola TaxID=176166 RepID=A0ABR4IUM9_9EURO